MGEGRLNMSEMPSTPIVGWHPDGTQKTAAEIDEEFMTDFKQWLAKETLYALCHDCAETWIITNEEEMESDYRDPTAFPASTYYVCHNCGGKAVSYYDDAPQDAVVPQVDAPTTKRVPPRAAPVVKKEPGFFLNLFGYMVGSVLMLLFWGVVAFGIGWVGLHVFGQHSTPSDRSVCYERVGPVNC